MNTDTLVKNVNNFQIAKVRPQLAFHLLDFLPVKKACISFV